MKQLPTVSLLYWLTFYKDRKNEFQTTDGRVLELPQMRCSCSLRSRHIHRGHLPDSDERIDWSTFAETISPKNRDLVRSSEITPLLLRQLKFIREPLEPNMVITGLYNRVQAQGLNTQVLAGHGSLRSDIQEHGQYQKSTSRSVVQ